MPIMKSLNLRFAVANIKAMEDLVKAGYYGSVADVVRAAVRDLLNREYYNRQGEIDRLIARSGHSNDTYGSGDRAKGYKATHTKSAKPRQSVTAEETEETETEEEPEGTIGIGGPVAASQESVPTIHVKDDSGSERSEQEGA